MTKDFEYTIKSKGENELVLLSAIVQMGSIDNPFPKEWEDNIQIISSLEDYKKELFEKYFEITYKEIENE